MSHWKVLSKGTTYIRSLGWLGEERLETGTVVESHLGEILRLGLGSGEEKGERL